MLLSSAESAKGIIMPVLYLSNPGKDEDLKQKSQTGWTSQPEAHRDTMYHGGIFQALVTEDIWIQKHLPGPITCWEG